MKKKRINMMHDKQSPPPCLKPFFKTNPYTKFQYTNKKAIRILNPWDDDTLELTVDLSKKDLIDALNNLHLPPRFTAIWHCDTKDLEVIYTAFRIEKELMERSFEFRFDGHSYRCEFGKASERLLEIAGIANTTKPSSSTDHRNLQDFIFYMHYRNEKTAAYKKLFEPSCFWIRKIEYKEDLTVELCKHLNFYMLYYDQSTPYIIIHEPPNLETYIAKKTKYLFDEFPNVISGHRINPYFIGLWESARNAHDYFRKFLYLYQIIEYAAFYHLREENLAIIKKVIIAPETPAYVNDAAQQILDSLCEEQKTDEAKIIAIVHKVTNLKLLWKEINANKEYFSKETVFEGGFSVQPLIKEGWDEKDFLNAWMPKLPDILRKIRNALVHSREARMTQVIAPTRGNYQKLIPWVQLLSIIAMQSMIFSDID